MPHLAIFNLVGCSLSLLFSLLIANDPPYDAADALSHHETSRMLVVVGMFFWVAFCVTVKEREK